MDADSGAVHLLDEMAFDALNAIQAGDVAPLYQKYDEADVRELLGEIEEPKHRARLRNTIIPTWKSKRAAS